MHRKSKVRTVRGSGPHDRFAQEADELIRRFQIDRRQIELLDQAAELYKQSVNPESNQISLLLLGLYHFLKGKAERDDAQALRHLQRAYRLHLRLGTRTPELTLVRLAWLKRKIDMIFHQERQVDLPGLFLESAELLKQIGRNSDYHTSMFLHYLFELTKVPNFQIQPDNLDRMMFHAEKSNRPDVIYKAKVILHRIRAHMSVDPRDAALELEKSLEAIKLTTDRFGEDEAKGSLLFTKALSTGRPSERRRLLGEAARSFAQAGEPKKARMAERVAAPVPEAIRAVSSRIDQVVGALNSLGRQIQELAAPTVGPSAIFYHQSYLLERLKDVHMILDRLGTARKMNTHLSIRETRLRPRRHRPGKGVSKKRQAILRKQSLLQSQMKLDMESLYIFGNLVLDQWAHTVAYLVGLEQPEEVDFHKLVMLLQSRDYDGVLRPLWDRHGRDTLWVYYQLRFYRNIFVEHLRRPWQRGTTMSVYGEDFNLFIPTPPGWQDEETIQRDLESIRQYAPRWLLEAPDDYWEKRNPRRVLEVTFTHIDEIPEQQARDKVWRVWSVVGGSTPSYEIVAHRLVRFLEGSIATVMEIARAHPGLINVGRPHTPSHDSSSGDPN